MFIPPKILLGVQFGLDRKGLTVPINTPATEFESLGATHATSLKIAHSKISPRLLLPPGCFPTPTSARLVMPTSLAALAKSPCPSRLVASSLQASPPFLPSLCPLLLAHPRPLPRHLPPALIPPRLSPRTSTVAPKTYSTASNDDFKPEKALMDELRRLTQRQGADGPTLGPFMMPRGATSEHPLRKEEQLHWSRVGWTERGRRTLRMSRNVFVVSLGGCIGLLVVYSITSELFAPSSTTNLMGSTIKSLEESEGLRKILRGPYKFHSLSPQTSTSKHHSAGPIELRFWIEGCVDHRAELDWRSADWWKSWIGPLITSEAYHPPAHESHPEPHHSGEQGGRWWPGIMETLMPMTLGKSSSAGDRRSWSDFLLPTPGTFERGEVTAELLKDSTGQWTFKSLYVDFPDSQNYRYRLDVLAELRKKKRDPKEEEEPISHTRYRFWSRRINLG